jgi:hypothetical protein
MKLLRIRPSSITKQQVNVVAVILASMLAGGVASGAVETDSSYEPTLDRFFTDSYSPPGQEFDPSEWARHHLVRSSLVANLVHTVPLIGMKRDAAHRLLGEPDGKSEEGFETYSLNTSKCGNDSFYFLDVSYLNDKVLRYHVSKKVSEEPDCHGIWITKNFSRFDDLPSSPFPAVPALDDKSNLPDKKQVLRDIPDCSVSLSVIEMDTLQNCSIRLRLPWEIGRAEGPKDVSDCAIKPNGPADPVEYVSLRRPDGSNRVAILLKHADGSIELNPRDGFGYGPIPPLNQMTSGQADCLWGPFPMKKSPNPDHRRYALKICGYVKEPEVKIDVQFKDSHIDTYQIHISQNDSPSEWQPCPYEPARSAKQ